MTHDYDSIGWGIGIALFILAFIGLFVAQNRAAAREDAKLAKMAPEEREAYLAEQQQREKEAENNRRRVADDLKWGPVNSALICPHCQNKGKVRTKPITQKAGVSCGKATAAVLTAGVSLLATGLSRKQKVTEAHCGVCHSTWHF